MTQEPSHLGALPPELFDKIFFELDTIRDLANFIVTARFVYHRFSARRQTILFRVLQNELGPALPDARFLFVFPYSDPTDEVLYHEWIYVMAGVYRDMLAGGEGHGVRGYPGPPTVEELTELCRTLHLINFITDTYVTAQLGSFDLAGGGGTPATAPLSRPERCRVMRAFYRRQIVSNAWASTKRPAHWDDLDSDAFSNTSTEQGRRLGLFAAFDPWDMQQIDHADEFITHLCCALVLRAAEVAAAGGGREISPRQFGNLHARLDHLVRYLRAHRGVAKAAIGDLQSGKSPLYYDERWRKSSYILTSCSLWRTAGRLTGRNPSRTPSSIGRSRMVCRWTTLPGTAPAKYHLAGRMRCGGAMSAGMAPGSLASPGFPPGRAGKRARPISVLSTSGDSPASLCGTGNGSRR
ncbi:hypothetical protein MYCTH_2311755 [Thermothelomyces thermophilus ATCC 42464]|uniref:Uncharacterized protein n=1 Tax=Thermothelomyces thermophilus (strain ATCC 42464 / BCRC 31852 / DSM 1799) TaxID=573729 RepID=G2QPL1_THET4|nr:uncharacterized protein MYCTH_2311755 [Thermothelomyces thermophilus ATCC 42464]AEO61524.1 hypothetical protein MYCTH_2311755 [Thermothelomyces thermophilus ATCC 42464]